MLRRATPRGCKQKYGVGWVIKEHLSVLPSMYHSYQYFSGKHLAQKNDALRQRKPVFGEGKGSPVESNTHFALKHETCGLWMHVLQTSLRGLEDVRQFSSSIFMESVVDPVFWGLKFWCRIYFTAITGYITLITRHIIACYVAHRDKS